MRALTVQNVSAIHDGEKTALEGLLGERLRDDQQVVIMVLSPGQQEDDTRRLANVLLDLVDPEDVAAAVRLHSRRSNSAMLALVDHSEIPPEIDEDLQEERPW